MKRQNLQKNLIKLSYFAIFQQLKPSYFAYFHFLNCIKLEGNVGK